MENSTPNSRYTPRKNKLHLIYFLLAAFDLMTITGSLYLNHRIMKIYDQSLAVNEVWANRIADFSALGQIASGVNAPGNDIFETQNTNYERKKLKQKLAEFDRKYADVKQDLSQNLPPETSKKFIRKLEIIRKSVNDMSRSTEQVFQFFDNRELIEAGKNMAIMDRYYANLTSHLAFLANEVREIQKINFDEQILVARDFKRFEYIIGGFILIMVCFVLFYGNLIFMRFRANELEKMKHLEELEIREKEIEKAIVAAETANRSKSIFLTNMSHEIRTPMNAILGFTQILLRRKNLDSDQLKALQTIDSSGESLLRMINEILDISKIEAGKMEVNPTDFDLKGLITRISRIFELRFEEKPLDWKVQGITESDIVFGDELKLMGILINLIGNALKFTESGGVIFKCNSLEDNHYLFEIIDTGIGIPAIDQQNIFEPFHQHESGSKSGGTGLGLAIASKQLTLMESKLELESELGKGSRFYFNLLLPKANRVLRGRSDRDKNILHLAEGHHAKALIVDDVKENRDVLESFLADLKIEVIKAVDGKDGLGKVREYLPDIIFMDMRMPIMNGEEAIQAIHKEFGEGRFKIVIITASAFDQDRIKYIPLGVNEFITKPFRMEQIARCLDELLDVEFEYDEVTEEEFSNHSEPDYAKISLPDELFQKLKDAAEMSNITTLEKIIDKIQQIDENCHELGVHIKKILGRYQMDKIVEIIKKLDKGGK
jgi:signal transduction histidine kinase/DNA-binding NarL/FixJ family response regulator